MLTSTGNPNKVYIGYTGRGYQTRFKEHLSEAVEAYQKTLDDPTFRIRHLLRAIHKYGADSFKTIRINSYTTAEEAKAAEVLWIAQFKPKGKAWNETDGGEGVEGYKHTPETIDKLVVANTGENNPMFGKTQSAEARAKMSKSRKGKPKNPKHRANLTIANKARALYLPVEIAKFPNQKAATTATGISMAQYYRLKKANPDLLWPKDQRTKQRSTP